MIEGYKFFNFNVIQIHYTCGSSLELVRGREPRVGACQLFLYKEEHRMYLSFNFINNFTI